MFIAFLCIILIQVCAVIFGRYCMCTSIEADRWKSIHKVDIHRWLRRVLIGLIMRSKKELITIFSNNETTITVWCIHNTRAVATPFTLYLSKGINRLCNCHIAEGCVLYFKTYKSDKESLVEIPGSSRDKRLFMLYTTNRAVGGQSVGFTAGTVLSNGREKLLIEKIPRVVTKHVAARAEIDS